MFFVAVRFDIVWVLGDSNSEAMGPLVMGVCSRMPKRIAGSQVQRLQILKWCHARGNPSVSRPELAMRAMARGAVNYSELDHLES